MMAPFIAGPVTTMGGFTTAASTQKPPFKSAPINDILWGTGRKLGSSDGGSKPSSGSSSPTNPSAVATVPSLSKKMMVNQSVRNIPNPSLLTKQKNGSEMAPQKTVT